MEKLTINIPESKTALVKQLLKELGVVFQSTSRQQDVNEVRARLQNVSVWSEDDLQAFEDSKQAFDSLKPRQW